MVTKWEILQGWKEEYFIDNGHEIYHPQFLLSKEEARRVLIRKAIKTRNRRLGRIYK